MVSLIDEGKTTAENWDNKRVLTQLLAQKLLSRDFRTQLNILLSPDQVDSLELLELICKLCKNSKPMCVAVIEQKHYLEALGNNIRALVTNSSSMEMNDYDRRIQCVMVLWCVLVYHKQDLSQE